MCARQLREAARDHTTVVQMLLEIDEKLEETGYDLNNDDQCFFFWQFFCVIARVVMISKMI